MGAADSVQRDPRTDRNDGIPYDEQRHRLRNGNGGTGRTADDMAGNDADGEPGDRASQDRSDPVRASGSCDAADLRVYEKKKVDQTGRYETGYVAYRAVAG